MRQMHSVLLIPVSWLESYKTLLERFAYQMDLGRYPDLASDDARRRQSLFDFYSAESAAFGYGPTKAARYAMNRIGYLERNGRQFDSQILLDLETTMERTKGTVAA